MHLTLVRFCYSPKVTLGHLYCGPNKFATLEEPWIEDPDGPGGARREPGHYESCVPDGTYTLMPHSGKFKNVYCLINHALGVYRMPANKPEGQKWGRVAILIHSGNALVDTEGCILIGLEHDGFERIRNGTSRVAMDLLRRFLGDQSHQLTIRASYGTMEAP